MKKILVILTGGTICTSINSDGMLSVSENTKEELKNGYLLSDHATDDEMEFVFTKNLNILSENMTVQNWNEILNEYNHHIAKDDYDGVVIAHGTDTLAYSASVFSYLLAGVKIPVIFVSSNQPLSSARSNGRDNFNCAIECICRGIEPNVYAVYKNLSDGKMLLHLASRLRQCQNYSEDFHSLGEIDLSRVQIEKVKDIFPQFKTKPFMSDLKSVVLKDDVLLIDAHVGLDYSLYDFSKKSCVLHTTYHSGTACVKGDDKNSIFYLLSKCSQYGKDVYLCPAKLQKGTYETVGQIASHASFGKNFNFLFGMTKEATYAKLMVAYSCFENACERKEYVQNEQNFEYIER